MRAKIISVAIAIFALAGCAVGAPATTATTSVRPIVTPTVRPPAPSPTPAPILNAAFASWQIFAQHNSASSAAFQPINQAVADANSAYDLPATAAAMRLMDAWVRDEQAWMKANPALTCYRAVYKAYGKYLASYHIALTNLIRYDSQPFGSVSGSVLHKGTSYYARATDELQAYVDLLPVVNCGTAYLAP